MALWHVPTLKVFFAATLPQARIGTLERWQFDAWSRRWIIRVQSALETRGT
jgi:hypothetical protein